MSTRRIKPRHIPRTLDAVAHYGSALLSDKRAHVTDELRRTSYCILATAVGVACCRALGIDAREMSVEAHAMNAEMEQWIEDGQPAPRPDTAWGVGLINERPPGFPGNPGGWDGHLVVEVIGRGFLDLNCGPLGRPQYQMWMRRRGKLARLHRLAASPRVRGHIRRLHLCANLGGLTIWHKE